MAERPNCLKPDACTPNVRGGHCNSCRVKAMWRQPGYREKRRASAKAFYADPDNFAAHTAIVRANMKRVMADPVKAERVREGGRIQGARNIGWRPGNAALGGNATREKHLGWCPVEYREQYAHLCHNKRMKAADARAIIEGQMAADARRQIADFTARQIARVERERQQDY